MDYEETNFDEVTEAEDSLPEELVEDDGDNAEDLEEMFAEDVDDGDQEEQDAEETDGTGSEGPKEPGYVQRRISKAVEKAVADTEARFTAQIEALEAQYAPIKERLIQMDAQELVRSGQVKDLETAMELVRYRQGQPAAQEEPEEQPRNEQGQFVSRQSIADEVRAIEMKTQADKIIDKGGPDVIAEFNKNPEIKRKVINGEMDMYDVAEYMRSKRSKRPPSPMRSPNGANGIGPTAIENMSDAQFRKLDKMLDEGVRFTQKR